MEGTPNQVVRVALGILNIENVWGRMEAGCSVTTPCRHFNLREASIYSMHKPVVAYTPEGVRWAHRNLTSGGTGHIPHVFETWVYFNAIHRHRA